MSNISTLTDNSFDELIKTCKENFIIDIYAEWCGPCKILSKTLEGLVKEYPDIKFYKLNTDENENTPKSLNINSLPTVIFYKKGKEIKRESGAIPQYQIEEFIQTHF